MDSQNTNPKTTRTLILHHLANELEIPTDTLIRVAIWSFTQKSKKEQITDIAKCYEFLSIVFGRFCN